MPVTYLVSFFIVYRTEINTMISDEFKCIFIHIPKNAGTSIETIICKNEGSKNLLPDHRTILDMEPFNFQKMIKLYQYNNFHSLLRRTRYFIKKKKIGSFYKPTNNMRYNKYFKFTIVRNPWSRVYSWYRGVLRDHREQIRYRVKPDCSFSDFLKYHLHSQPGLRSQFYWICDSKGNIPMNFIGKFEKLESDFLIIAQSIGLKGYKLPKKRYTGNSFSYVDAYDDNTKDIIWHRYRKEIDYFGFEFNEYK